MPHYHIHIASDDGALDSEDREGVTLGSIGLLRALATESLIEASRERPAPGKARTITVIACDEHGRTVYRDTATVRGVNPEDEAVGRAIQAMGRGQG